MASPLPHEMLPKLDKPEDCLKRAAACERMAKTKDDPQSRQTLLFLAGHWRQMATAIERKTPKHPPAGSASLQNI